MDTEHTMEEPSSSGKFPTFFFALTILLSLPFYVLHALAHLHIFGDSVTLTGRILQKRKARR